MANSKTIQKGYTPKSSNEKTNNTRAQANRSIGKRSESEARSTFKYNDDIENNNDDVNNDDYNDINNDNGNDDVMLIVIEMMISNDTGCGGDVSNDDERYGFQ